MSAGSGAPAPDVLSRLEELGVVPIIVLDDPNDAVPLVRTLVDVGLPCAEVTFRTAAAAEAIGRIAAELPDVLLGAGTVLRPEQVDEARAAGARFILTPGFNPRVVERCQKRDVPVFPGVCTPTDIEAALERGLSVLKFFPAEALGVRYLKALTGPYPDVRYLPTGGIHGGNLAAWLALPQVVACGGSWMVPRNRIRDRDFDHVRREVAGAVDIVRSRPGG